MWTRVEIFDMRILCIWLKTWCVAQTTPETSQTCGFAVSCCLGVKCWFWVIWIIYRSIPMTLRSKGLPFWLIFGLLHFVQSNSILQTLQRWNYIIILVSDSLQMYKSKKNRFVLDCHVLSIKSLVNSITCLMTHLWNNWMFFVVHL